MKYFSFVFLLSAVLNMNAQKGLYTGSPAFEAEIENYLSFSIPVISVQDLAENHKEYIIFDAREEEEYELSHIPDARHLGYNKPNWKWFDGLDKNTAILLYCSIGYRSEKLGESLKKKGFKNVYNLFGSIFEWANQGFLLVDSSGKKTKKVHGYNKSWSKWIRNEDLEVFW